jgi:hypothetical protein
VSVRIASVLAAVLAVGCASGPPPAPDDPLRPQAKPLPPVVAVQERVPLSQPLAQSAEDCEPMAPNEGPPPRPSSELDIPGAQSHADQGLRTLIESERNIPADEVASKIESAVSRFFTSLSADPYNIRSTYNLAAAYARIGRNQCSLNLLARLVAMKDFPSRRKAVADVRDRLKGQGKRWKGKPDPDFRNLRGRPEFEQIVKGF